MSLVGPRPKPREIIDRYQSRYGETLRVRPGLTCLAAIEGRNTLRRSQMIDADQRYASRVTLASDLAHPGSAPSASSSCAAATTPWTRARSTSRTWPPTRWPADGLARRGRLRAGLGGRGRPRPLLPPPLPGRGGGARRRDARRVRARRRPPRVPGAAPARRCVRPDDAVRLRRAAGSRKRMARAVPGRLCRATCRERVRPLPSPAGKPRGRRRCRPAPRAGHGHGRRPAGRRRADGADGARPAGRPSARRRRPESSRVRPATWTGSATCTSRRCGGSGPTSATSSRRSSSRGWSAWATASSCSTRAARRASSCPAAGRCTTSSRPRPTRAGRSRRRTPSSSPRCGTPARRGSRRSISAAGSPTATASRGSSSRWAPGRAPFFVGSAIHDPGAYAELCAAAGEPAGDRFPAYR